VGYKWNQEQKDYWSLFKNSAQSQNQMRLKGFFSAESKDEGLESARQSEERVIVKKAG
jgi:uncharacterized protein YutD